MLKSLAKFLHGDRRTTSASKKQLSVDFLASSLLLMRPLAIVVLSLGVLEFIIFLFARERLTTAPPSWSIYFGFISALTLLAVWFSRTTTVASYGFIGVLYVTLITAGFLFSSRGVEQMVSWVLPALMLVPITAGPLWLTRSQFVFGTTVCALVSYFVLYSLEMSTQEKISTQLYFVMALTLSATLHLIFLKLRLQSFELSTSLFREASLDSLTGLLNRRAFLEQAKFLLNGDDRNDRHTVALYVDLDKFKTINDSFGHAAGDHALCAVASKLAEHLRAPDLIGRLGGEEFAVIANVETDIAGIALAERLKESISLLDLGDRKLSISIGLAFRFPGEGIELLLQRADAAMLRAKRNGRNRIEKDDRTP